MNIREACLATADHFEKHPELFCFQEPAIPPDCGTPACLAGYVGFFLGADRHDSLGSALRLYCDANEISPYSIFQGRICMICAEISKYGIDWIHNPALAAKCLRIYADRYHPDNVIHADFGKPKEETMRRVLRNMEDFAGGAA